MSPPEGKGIITMNVEIKIYVANLAAYTSGFYKGEWITLPMEKEELEEVLNKISYDGRDELAIHDYEIEISHRIEEYDNIFNLNELAEKLEEIGDDNAFLALTEACDSLNDAIEYYESGSYAYYSATSREDLGYELVEMGCYGNIPESLENYIDYEAIGRDADYNGAYITAYGTVEKF